MYGGITGNISDKINKDVLIAYGQIDNTIRVPESVKAMEAGKVPQNNSGSDYEKLVNMIIPESVTSIADDTFGDETYRENLNLLINANKGSYGVSV